MVACERSRATDRGSFPGSSQGENPGEQLYDARAEQLGQLRLPGCDEALSGMGGASFTSEMPGVSRRRFLSEVGYATLPMRTLPQIVNIKKRHISAMQKERPRREALW